MQVRDAMRQTANNAASPDNLQGWGLLNADSAVRYFGVLPLGKIQGNCFYDLNGNGVRDAGEGAVVGAKIILSGTMNLTTTTDVSGNYEFDSLAVGDYAVSESLAAGYGQSVPESSYTLHLLHGQVAAGLDFGRYGYGSISGNVYDDQNMNGNRDLGEPGLADWTLELSGAFVAETASDTSGNYRFSKLPPGSYSLSENPAAGWLRSEPGGNGVYHITLGTGVDTSGFLFGNYYAPTANYPVVGGWNLLSLPDSINDFRVKSVYPSAISDAFTYDASYIVEDTLATGLGYWLKFAAPENIHIPGNPKQSEVVQVHTGWNMIGSLFTPAPVSEIQQTPSGIVASSYYSYDGGYHTADTLFPHHGYWVKVNAGGQLSIFGTGMDPSARPVKPAPKPAKASGATPAGSSLPDQSRPSKR
jgi:hypothetical protein